MTLALGPVGPNHTSGVSNPGDSNEHTRSLISMGWSACMHQMLRLGHGGGLGSGTGHGAGPSIDRGCCDSVLTSRRTQIHRDSSEGGTFQSMLGVPQEQRPGLVACQSTHGRVSDISTNSSSNPSARSRSPCTLYTQVLIQAGYVRGALETMPSASTTRTQGFASNAA